MRQCQVDRRRMWKPRHAAKRAVMSVVGAEHRRFDVVDGNGSLSVDIVATVSAVLPGAPNVAKSWRRGIAGRTIDGVDYALQDGWQTIDADERAAAENLAVGVEKRGGRPPAERVTAADIRPPIGVNADRHEPLGNEPGDGGIGIACSIHFVTAARPRRDNRKQDRFSFGFGTCERRRAPR